MTQPGPVERFHSLDILRGIAALSVVLFHWRHFISHGARPEPVDFARLPLYDFLSVVYTHGWLAVDLFFALSGFIFYWLYAQRVAAGAISPFRFASLRFSRLYPLYFVTLLAAAAGQVWWMSQYGKYFVHVDNDAQNFVLNLFFASSWVNEYAFSFNGPAWSVSVEVLLYALFFVCCRLLPIRVLVLAILSIIGFVLVRELNGAVGRGIGSFFLGGCVFLGYQAIIASRHRVTITRWAAGLAAVAWLLTLAPIPWSFPKTLDLAWSVALLFPLTILSLALIETHRGSLGKRVSFIGDISYSSYLLHFPLQLLFAALALSPSVYYSHGLMALFFAVLIPLCLASYHYLELPAQRFLRELSGPPRAGDFPRGRGQSGPAPAEEA